MIGSKVEVKKKHWLLGPEEPYADKRAGIMKWATERTETVGHASPQRKADGLKEGEKAPGEGEREREKTEMWMDAPQSCCCS